MVKLQRALERVLEALRATALALAIAQRRYLKQVAREQRFKAKKLDARAQADKHRKAGKAKRAAHADGRAGRFAVAEAKARQAKQDAMRDVKRLNREVKDLELDEAQLREKIKRISGPRVKGNKVVGGTPEERLQVALLTAARKCKNGSRRNFYSQLGAYDIDHALTGEQYGDRSDCSQFGAAIRNSCGLDSPGTWTGDQEHRGRAVTREYARKHAGCAVLFGPRGNTHHVEWSIGDGSERTVGHGSPPVDIGSFDLIPGTVQFRAYDD